MQTARKSIAPSGQRRTLLLPALPRPESDDLAPRPLAGFQRIVRKGALGLLFQTLQGLGRVDSPRPAPRRPLGVPEQGTPLTRIGPMLRGRCDRCALGTPRRRGVSIPYRLERSVCTVSAARKTEQKVMRTMPIMYSATGQGRPSDQPSKAVAINGASPPANGAANCDPSDAPL